MNSLPTPRELLWRYQARAKRSLGQHFLLDEQSIRRIAELAQLSRCEDRSALTPEAPKVLEIGPGCGALTQALLGYTCTLLAVEKDDDAVSFLSEVFGNVPGFELEHGDFLRYQWPEQLDALTVVGNLPYNIGTEIWFRLLAERHRIRRMVLMFQREVAHRFVAERSTKAYGILSVIAQQYFDVSYAMSVEPGAFRPVPEVTSAVLLFVPRNEPQTVDEAAFRALVRASFAQRRKTLANSLSGYRGRTKVELEALLQRLGHDTRIRAENLTPADFVALCAALED
ncbi:MAG: 16S rRNA (adenine(1518)-N(6)/adenine(1519)-N(6))-dimethyltransferase RsmA [Myxococcota bacterium]|jgi:16S rRNA (adenine1518-N6/adenine1519-N6)-dimethyltransferase|nr:16S rRNA (adenine(1518)-N(6)/adenine(1519)-N(6))-dimethyltransferase RsmA [Myxococcota bacterium]